MPFKVVVPATHDNQISEGLRSITAAIENRLYDGPDNFGLGGESGPGARPDDHQWYRDGIAQTRGTGCKWFQKQLWGPNGKAIKDMDQFPEGLRVREIG